MTAKRKPAMRRRSPETLAKLAGWDITLDHNNEYVAHYEDDEKPSYVLEAEDEDEAWQELCSLEGLC